MFAVVRTGGKQYRVAPEDVIQVERLAAEAGQTIELSEVLAIGDNDSVSLGRPLVDGARVAATVVEHKRGDKIIVFRKKRRKNFRRKRGHRQDLTVLRIDEILAAGERRTPAKKAAKPRKTAKAKAKEAADAPAAKAKEKKPPKPKAKAAKAPAAKGEAQARGKKAEATGGQAGKTARPSRAKTKKAEDAAPPGPAADKPEPEAEEEKS